MADKCKPCKIYKKMCDVYRDVCFCQKMFTTWLKRGLPIQDGVKKTVYGIET